MRFVVFFTLAGLVGCASPPPYEDYVLARAAVKSAREADAPRLSPLIWAQADEYFRQAERNYHDNNFDKARPLFLSALKTAEKAETAARVKKFMSGQGAPP